ncbi:MAG: zinc ribbon domain-containing protein [Desulfuromonadales bacterium]|nr:zinc ribbon domain-containing protein [Desulfuromonadales bacterium]
MKCLKCGFEIAESGAASCPSCGVVFAKVQRAKKEESDFLRRLAAERGTVDSLQKEMEAAEEIRSHFELDPEYARDEDAYLITRFLSTLFAFLAIFAAVVEVIGMIQIYQWGRGVLSPRDLLLLMVFLAVASAAFVVALLAVSEGLRMGRDVANHARAMREYLRRGAGHGTKIR